MNKKWSHKDALNYILGNSMAIIKHDDSGYREFFVTINFSNFIVKAELVHNGGAANNSEYKILDVVQSV